MSTLSFEISGTIGDFYISAAANLGRATLGLIGPNGAGKTTLLKMLLGIHHPSAGHIEIATRTLFDANAGINVPAELRKIGYVPQHSVLFEHMSVRQNIAFGMQCTRIPTREIRHRVDDLLDRFRLSALSTRSPHTLSGGEKQRVALARAMAIEPCALFLDEPLSAAAPDTRRHIYSLLEDFLSESNLPTIIVTHDAECARTLCSDILALDNGRVTQSGSMLELQKSPATPFIRDFFTPQVPGVL